MPIRSLRPYTSAEVATMLGISVDTLYRSRELRHDRDGLPRPIGGGRMKWERSGFDAWLTRFHPLRPPRPANDVIAPPDAATIEEHQRDLHAYYAERMREIAAAKAGHKPSDPAADDEHRRRLHEAYGKRRDGHDDGDGGKGGKGRKR